MFKWIIDCCLIFILFTIFIEDIRTRQVHFLLFVAGLALLIFKFLQSEADFSAILINGGFIGVQLLGVSLFIYVTQKDIRKIKDAIGLGDVIMWALLIFGFSPINFMLFFIVSLLVSLSLYRLFMRQAVLNHVPLAGLQAIQYLTLLLGSIFGLGYNLYSDDLLVKFIFNGI